MSEVALFGGAYNPIGLHHQQIAELIWDKLQIHTWMMPCFHHLFDKDSQLINSAHRWNMVSEVCRQFKFMKPFDWELAHEHTGSTYIAMEKIARQYPDNQFSIVIGSDNANILKEAWFRGEELIDLFPFIVVERFSEPLTVEWPQKPPHHILPCSTAQVSSSTAIRKAIREGRNDFAKQYLNLAVWDYIRTGGLYGYHSNGH